MDLTELAKIAETEIAMCHITSDSDLDIIVNDKAAKRITEATGHPESVTRLKETLKKLIKHEHDRPLKEALEEWAGLEISPPKITWMQ